MSTINENPRWFWYPIWMGLSFLCIPLAIFLDIIVRLSITQVTGDTIVVNGVSYFMEDYLFRFTFLPIAGLLTGGLQYALLRRTRPLMGWWVLATTGGWLLGLLLFLLTGGSRVLNLELMILGIGLAIVLAQWLLLRRRLVKPGWWIGANVLSWGLVALVAATGAPGAIPTAADTCPSVPQGAAQNPSASPSEGGESTFTPRNMDVLFDDDGSRDGTAALLYLLSYSEISIQAVSVSYGEAHPELYIQHMGYVLEKLGFEGISLGAGQDMPLAGGTPFPDWLRQQSDNFWDYPLPDEVKTYPYQDAADLMVSTINQAPEPVTLFVSGPFTNLAQALQRDPAIKGNIAAVYFMGGAVCVPGNIIGLVRDSDNLVADWNMIADPQAAKEVFEAGLELYMVPLDATHQVLFSQEDIQPWRQGDEKANLVVDLYDNLFDTWGLPLAEIFDLTAAVLMVQPELCNFQPLHLDVITDDGPTLGQTLVVPGSEPNTYVCLEPNVNLVKQNLYETFSP